jgi:hypothetical protein
MPPSSDLPPWLRNAGAPARRTQRRAASTAVFALLLFGAGVGAGFLFARRGVAVATPPPPAPVCPPAVACPPPAPTGVAHAARPGPAAKRAKPAAPKALSPLPEQAPMDENVRFQALRDFAHKKGPELKDCVAEPDQGPTLKFGVAFEIASDGAVDAVQILGADNSLKDAKRCYANRLKHWRFPEELLRGEEKLIVNFVL